MTSGPVDAAGLSRPVDEIRADRRVCSCRWPSSEDRNPHECSQRPGHLGLHRCGCGAVSA